MGENAPKVASYVLYDRILLRLSLGLAGIGFVMGISASLPISERLSHDPFFC